VYPFSATVAERFGKKTSYKTPVIESTGSGGGMKLFCAGVGLQHPDVTNASRRMKAKEFKMCTENGVTITEFIVGNDGLAFANSKNAAQLSVSIAHFAAALAAELPARKGSAIEPNSNMTWADVDDYVANYSGTAKLGLPATKIRVLVPPPTSGTRDAMGVLFMENGHKKLGTYDAVGKSGAQKLREDGAAIEVGENDNLIVAKLVADRDLMGVFGFSFFDQNRDKVQASVMDGVELTFDNISSYNYPGARPLYAYVKREHLEVIPGLKRFFEEFISARALGIEGYLFPVGLVPLSESDFGRQSAKVRKFPAITIN
ncbi:MAG: substrate-binding domain-containing protein, partial [Alphaproteobacteria bacterium]|nr:substrate-binding domain-containing protein [Alphaproteobacteria bacterium]